jgi:GT2 family glycosyltransferase
MKMINANEILWIVVLYKQKLSESITLQSLKSNPETQNISVLLYDNSPEAFIQEKIDEEPFCKVKYIRNEHNPGVSAAYNEGAAYAASLHKQWIVLLDQDTMLPANFISTLLHSISLYPEQVLFAPALMAGKLQISPCRYIFAKGFPRKTRSLPGIHRLRRTNLLNSGLCIKLTAFYKAGGYPNKVRIYYSDFVFINRFKKKYQSFAVMDINLTHSMSALEKGNVEEQLKTFSLFCIGAREASAEQPGYFLFYFLNTLLRCLKLTVRHRSGTFISYFGKFFLAEKNNDA